MNLHSQLVTRSRAQRGGAGLLTLSLLLALGGCPQTNNPPALTTAQQSAVGQVSRMIEALGQASGSMSSLEDSQVKVGDFQAVTFGTCPAVAIERTANTATITLDFGDGCDAPATADLTVRGRITLSVRVSTGQATVNFDGFAIASRSIDGTADVEISRESGGVKLNGTIDLDIEGVGAIDGDFIALIRSNGTITIDFADVDLTTATSVFQVVLESLVSDPLTNNTFVPQSGRATFEVPSETNADQTETVVVTFDDQSPVDGSVSVTVEGGQSIDYTIPGLN